MIIVVFVACVYLIQLLIGAIVLLGYFKKNPVSLSKKIEEVSIVIPFKNEANRIQPLLQRIKSFNIPKGLKTEFIFVDDNSSDGSDHIVKANLSQNSDMITSGGTGKKEAIRYGVNLASNEFIITWDADVLPSINYLDEVIKLREADMWILPVHLGGRKLIQRLGAIEFSWLQLLGIGFAKLLNPNLCNGANLLFRKKLFLQLDEQRSDYNIASGDDMFLLAAFKEAEADIMASSTHSLAVKADSPDSFISLVIQRKRWAGKMSQLKSRFSVFYGFLLVVFVFLGFVLLSMTHLGWIVLIPVCMKILNEFIMLQCEKRFADWISDLPVVILHQVWYPFYLVRLLLPVKKNDKRWDKER